MCALSDWGNSIQFRILCKFLSWMGLCPVKFSFCNHWVDHKICLHFVNVRNWLILNIDSTLPSLNHLFLMLMIYHSSLQHCDKILLRIFVPMLLRVKIILLMISWSELLAWTKFSNVWSLVDSLVFHF